MDPKHIENTLYEQYYKDDQTPDGLVSSVWRDFHQTMTNVKENEVGSRSLNFNLGDYEFNKLHHRLTNWMTISSYRMNVVKGKRFNALVEKAKLLAKRMGLKMTYDSFRQVCTVNMLLDYIDVNKTFRVINIGDGYGFLSSLIKETFENSQLVCVDLGKTLIFQSHYCMNAFPNKKHFLNSNDLGKTQEHNDSDFIYCPAENIEQLGDMKFDLALNVDSMQEMNVETVAYYFAYLRKHLNKKNMFYCCNRIEKVMPGGEISKFYSYPWKDEDLHHLEGPCPWQKYYFSFHKTERGPKLLGLRIPLMCYYDGDIHHRLTRMAID